MVGVVSIGIKECVCRKCNSRLSYSENEVKEYKINYDYLGDYDIIKGIECPICSNKVDTRKKAW